MSIDIDDIERRMDGALASFKTDLAGLRTGRASAGLLEPIMVDAYGQMMPISQVGTVSVPEPRLLTVQVWDKGQVAATEKAIRESNLGLNPMTEGQLIRIPLPELNEERREELVKVAGAMPSKRVLLCAMCAAMAWTRLRKRKRTATFRKMMPSSILTRCRI